MSARPSTNDPHAAAHRDVSARIQKLYDGRQARLQLPLRLASQYGDFVLDVDQYGRLIATGPSGTVTVLADP